MRYKLKISALSNNFNLEQVDELGKHMQEKIPGVETYSLKSTMNFTNNIKFTGKTQIDVEVCFLGRFNPADVLCEVCDKGYSVKYSKLEK